MNKKKTTTKLFICDLNWSFYAENKAPLSAPQDWAFIDPKEYFDWLIDLGNNAIYFHAYAQAGYAFYPTKLGPIAPGPGADLLPSLYEMAKKAGVPFWSYFSVSADPIMSSVRDDWVIPGTRNCSHYPFNHGFMGPESPWTDLLCERIEEFLTDYPADWMQFDWFGYGPLKPDFHVQPAWFVKKPFKEIIGRDMPEYAIDITCEENLKYKREVLARQFYRIKDAVKKTSPQTKIMFNVPYWHAYEPLWVNHPMMNESDGLLAESSDDEVLNWLLEVKKPGQIVMTTIVGRFSEEGVCDPNSWRKWYEKGCDFQGYAWGTPPDFRPHKFFKEQVDIVREAFKVIE